VTTIEALNATGVVYAVQDGPAHVSVRPVGATMFGIGSKTHGIHTTIALQAVLSIGQYGGRDYEENGIHK
jgi:hypothetical protein